VDEQKNDYEKSFNISLETRNFEIELFWKRSIFFWGFITASFIAFAQLYKINSGFAVIIANFGFICSLAWTLANRGSKFWQENWEQKVAEYEKNIDLDLFSRIEKIQMHKFCILRARKYSVGKLAICLSDYTTIFWFLTSLVLLLNELNPSFIQIHKVVGIISFWVFTFIYFLYVIIFAKTTEKLDD